MSAQIKIVNDGPDIAVVKVGDRFFKRLGPGEGMVLVTSQTVSFSSAKPPTMRELAEANGVSEADYMKNQPYKGPTRYADPE